jgi:hypothetical protein
VETSLRCVDLRLDGAARLAEHTRHAGGRRVLVLPFRAWLHK